MVFELTARGVEGVADRDMRILMRMVRARVPADDDLASGNGEIDPNLEQLALLMPLVPAFDDDPAGGDTIEELIELFRPLAYPRFECGRGRHMPEGNLERQLHRMSPAGD
jgi:hypothetical protein